MRFNPKKDEMSLPEMLRAVFADESEWHQASGLKEEMHEDAPVQYPPLNHTKFVADLKNAVRVVGKEMPKNTADHFVVAEILVPRSQLTKVVKAANEILWECCPDGGDFSGAVDFDDCMRAWTVTQTPKVEKTWPHYSAVHILLHKSLRVEVASKIKSGVLLDAEDRAALDKIFTSPAKWKRDDLGVETVQIPLPARTGAQLEAVQRYALKRIEDGKQLLSDDQRFANTHAIDTFANGNVESVRIVPASEGRSPMMEISLDAMRSKAVAAAILREQKKNRFKRGDGELGL